MRRLLLGSLIALVLATTGCGAGSDPDPTPSATSTPNSSPASSPEESSAEPSPTDPATTTPTGPAPASGVAITSSYAQVNAPAGWSTNPLLVEQGGNVNGPNGNAFYNVLLNDVASDYPDDSTDYAAALSQKACCYRPPLERQPDTTLGGQPAYHLAGTENFFGAWADEYGIRYQGHTITVTVRTPRDLAPAKREAINAGILASFQLTG